MKNWHIEFWIWFFGGWAVFIAAIVLAGQMGVTAQ